MTISKMSKDAIIGPGITANSPVGMPGQLCRPYTASQGNRSNRPSSTIARPPPSFSSAGWKMKCTVPSKSRRLGEMPRRAEQHGRVAVVAAGVHAAFVARAMRELVLLVDVQRVHVGAQADRARTRARAQRADHAGAADAAMDFETEGREPVGHERRRAHFLERGLGMGVQVAPPRLHVGVQRREAAKGVVHGAIVRRHGRRPRGRPSPRPGQGTAI